MTSSGSLISDHPQNRRILGVRVDATSYAAATSRILQWAEVRRSCYVCCAAVNNIMEARRSLFYGAVMEEASLVTADGMPLVWLLQLLGVPDASRVYGPDLTLAVLAATEQSGVPVGFYGGSDEVLARLLTAMRARFPQLNIAFAEAPPFRPPTAAEDEQVMDALNRSEVRILFVGLGSPKQDLWMQAHRGRVNAVMLGVGAAFDFLAGVKPQAPRLLQNHGLEWCFRLVTEPRRLWRRYLSQNPRFVLLALAQLLRTCIYEHRRPA